MTLTQVKELEKIEAAVCEEYGVTLKQLQSKSRKDEINMARQAAVFLADRLNLTREKLLGRYNRSHCLYYKIMDNMNFKYHNDNHFRMFCEGVNMKLCEHDLTIYESVIGERIMVCSKCDYLERI